MVISPEDVAQWMHYELHKNKYFFKTQSYMTLTLDLGTSLYTVIEAETLLLILKFSPQQERKFGPMVSAWIAKMLEKGG